MFAGKTSTEPLDRKLRCLPKTISLQNICTPEFIKGFSNTIVIFSDYGPYKKTFKLNIGI